MRHGRAPGRRPICRDRRRAGAGEADRLVGAFVRHGASQCGFCTPGILCRLSALGPAPIAGPGGVGPARPPVPVHRLAEHR